MIKYDIGVKGLQDAFTTLGAIQPLINAALPHIVNRNGQNMRYKVINAIATRFNVSPDAVASSITEQLGSPLASYSMTGTDWNFPYVRWSTMRDEKVCRICGPRDGVIYTREEAMQIWPAHPNCRCALEAVGVAPAMMENVDTILQETMIDAVSEALTTFSDIWSKMK